MRLHPILVFALSACAVLSVHAADLKIGVVDMEKLVRCHPNTESDRKLLEEMAKDFGERREELRDQIENAAKAFEAAAQNAQNAALSDKARQRAESEALAKREEAIAAEKAYGAAMRDMQKQLSDQQARMLRRTYVELQAAVAAYAKENGFTFISEAPTGDKAGSPASVVYFDESLDITPAIMDRLGLREPPPEADDAPDAPEAAEE
ncbi:MAG: OmpH family outer membrane protein [Kiritimatiellia bacterium]|jgi:Skp family chaperone for outer membrane proteins